MLDGAPLHDYSHSQAVVMGTWDYEYLTAVPAARNSFDRLVRLLTGPLCGWPGERLLVLPNERDPGDLPDRLITAFEEVTDVALFYYVGHGQIDTDDQLCLGLVRSRTEPNRRAATSLPFPAIRRALLDSEAATKIVLLDCCFAGLANRPASTLAALPDDVLDKTAGTGAYTMAATSAYATAWYETDPKVAAPQTFFTRYLADLVDTGMPGQPSGLRLHPLFVQLRDNLARDGRPIPEGRSVDAARDFVFARNAAPPETQRDPDVELRHLTERLAAAEAKRLAAEAQILELRTEAAERAAELQRLQQKARHIQSMEISEQRELRKAIEAAAHSLEETTDAQAAASEAHADSVVAAGSDAATMAGHLPSAVATGECTSSTPAPGHVGHRLATPPGGRRLLMLGIAVAILAAASLVLWHGISVTY